MHVQFWGTRGSLPKPGPTTARYGGNTSCVELRSTRGTIVVIDCGTGAHALGLKLMSSGANAVRGHILIGHTHWDHIQGLPFFAPLFVPGNEWDIYGPKGLDQSLRETLAGQMQHTYFPMAADQFGATVRYHDLLEGTFEVGDIKVSTQYLNHPALTLGYRLEADGATVVYCCDHEPYSRAVGSGQEEFVGQDLRHAEFVRGADLLIHDAQYTAAEYSAKMGWGHSSTDYAVKVAQQAGVKKLALTHHDLLRDDDALDRLVESIQAGLQGAAPPLEVFAAAEGQVIEVTPSHARSSGRSAGKFRATTPLESALSERSVLLSIVDSSMAVALSEAIRAEGIRANVVSSIDEAQKLLAKDRPSLALLEHDMARIDGMNMCRAIRQTEGDELPVVMVAAREDLAAGTAAGVTDWLIKPFTASYARTKIRSWVLRTACRWIRAAMPDDEEQRLASLHRLKILDTEPEERFDRVTRLAAALFDVPMVRISLVDENRQWFKSCVGSDLKETPRDEAMCAHVVYTREPMIVPDTFLDARFADNPMVVNDPRIRFYAGYPLVMEDGSCLGTLCLLDTRPRTIKGPDLERLHDLADIALREIRGVSP
jgi:phosphoribosyl 1,2-cyclic phosphodiesterase/CheY-like chemotaxis protein